MADQAKKRGRRSDNPEEEAIDVFNLLRTNYEERVEQRSESINNIVNKKAEEVLKRQHEEQKTRDDAEECKALLGDDKYPGMQRYLNTLLEKMNNSMARVHCTSQAREELLFEAARLGYGISLIKDLQARPMVLLEQLKRMENRLDMIEKKIVKKGVKQ